MCIAFYTSTHPDYAFILAANRDEFYARPTESADWRQLTSNPGGHDSRDPNILCGVDLIAKGTWLGVCEDGRFALLTNFTEPAPDPILPDGRPRPSRGALVTAFLTAQGPASDAISSFVQGLDGMHLDEYAGFNLVVGVLIYRPAFAVISNRPKDRQVQKYVVFAGAEVDAATLCNGHFLPDLELSADLAWEKVVNGSQGFLRCLHDSRQAGVQNALITSLLEHLSTPSASWDPQRPFETIRSSVCLTPCNLHKPAASSDDSNPSHKGAYGTRSQVVITMSNSGKVTFVERQAWVLEGSDPVPKWSGKEKSFDFALTT